MSLPSPAPIFLIKKPQPMTGRWSLEIKHSVDAAWITWLFWPDRYTGPPLVSVGSELILHSSMKTADFLSLLFVGDDQDSEKSKPAGSDGERRGVKRQRDEKDEHGRAYYEFREEAYHSRWGKQSLSLKGVSALILVYLLLTGQSGKRGGLRME